MSGGFWELFTETTMHMQETCKGYSRRGKDAALLRTYVGISSYNLMWAAEYGITWR